jgi:hypothetical protein
MEVSGQLHAPAALPPGKELLVPIGEEAGWAPEPFWTWWWREKFRESNPRTPIVQPVAQRYNDWAIMALVIPKVQFFISVRGEGSGSHTECQHRIRLSWTRVLVCLYFDNLIIYGPSHELSISSCDFGFIVHVSLPQRGDRALASCDDPLFLSPVLSSSSLSSPSPQSLSSSHR